MTIVNRSFLERRTENIEKGLIRWGLHPDPDNYKLILDYNSYYGGYQMVFQKQTSPMRFSESRWFLSSSRLKASEMEEYRQGLFDMLAALGNSPRAVEALKPNYGKESTPRGWDKVETAPGD